MGIAGSAAASANVYIVGVQRAVPGHREQLLKSLSAPGATSKIEMGSVVLQHLEWGDWTFATTTRYNSWQDFAADRMGAAYAGDATSGGWADIRQHSGFHRDTIADRIQPSRSTSASR